MRKEPAHIVMDAETLHFFQSVGLGDNAESLVEPLLRAELSGILANSWAGQYPGVCLLTDIGDYLVRMLDMISALARALVDGGYIRDHMRDRLLELEDEHDLRTTGYLDDKHAALKLIVTKISRLTEICKTEWDKSPLPPIAPPVRGNGFGSSAYPAELVQPSFEPMQAPNEYPNSGDWQSPSSADRDQSIYSSGQSNADVDPNYAAAEQSAEAPSPEKLKQRGKGSYTCPHGTKCKKGGVDKNGNLKVFSRNSEFRAHLDRHDKTYKCDLPGCTNTKGFARPDQLERHKQTVKHNGAAWVPGTPQARYDQG